MSRHFDNLADMLRCLEDEGVQEVAIAGKVATTTSPRGEDITFRGRLIVSADVGGKRAQYVEQVRPYVTHMEPCEVTDDDDQVANLQRCRLVLTRQLSAYRKEYRGLMESARASLVGKLREAGVGIVEPPE
jgi:hypothetical protein